MKKDYQYYVYIATNHPRHTVLYTGITNGLIKRSGQHSEKIFPTSFTAKYNVNKIVYAEIFGEVYMAIAREKQIKRLVRRKKIELINFSNPKWEDLIDKLLK